MTELVDVDTFVGVVLLGWAALIAAGLAFQVIVTRAHNAEGEKK